MGPLVRNPLPSSVSHSNIHNPTPYSNGLSRQSDYKGGFRGSPALVKPVMEMSDYYFSIDSPRAPYDRGIPSFPAAPSAYLPPYSHSGDFIGRHITPDVAAGDGSINHCRPSSASSKDSVNQVCNGPAAFFQPQTDLHLQHSFRDVPRPSISCTSSVSSDNESHLPKEPINGIPVIKSEASLQDLRELKLPSINSNSSSSSPDQAESYLNPDEESSPRDENGGHFGENFGASQKDSENPTIPCASDSTTNSNISSKNQSGKKPTNVKVSEKRRQQNRAAQRAMRERRKRAAQHQEVHMSAILTENALLREKVNYLSNLLLTHAIAPGSQFHHWSSLSTHDNQASMLPPLNSLISNGPPATNPQSTPAVTSSQNPTIALANNASGQLVLSSHSDSSMSYYSPTTFDSDCNNRGRDGLPGIKTSNFSRPGTGDDSIIESENLAYNRWHAINFGEPTLEGSESPINKRSRVSVMPPVVSTECCSANTASTGPSPTQTEFHQIDQVNSVI
ncbi:expressed protein [Phakopsora pachyrhizi]|uniref:Expressed protein n=1 Tax=Phakopsora pachyrhizi TaxID=170000 RepID=A0AAV0B0S4_PHAPC|nr:expressed protein [Phakopsora pachyrhizi]